MTKHRSRRRRVGLTLIEVALALGVTATVAAVSLGGVVGAARTSRRVDARLQAELTALHLFEVLRGLDLEFADALLIDTAGDGPDLVERLRQAAPDLAPAPPDDGTELSASGDLQELEPGLEILEVSVEYRRGSVAGTVRVARLIRTAP